MKMRFENAPESKKFETRRKKLFKPEDGIRNMTFAETIEIEISVSAIRNEESRKELETLADKMMEESQKIIAEHEAPQ